jgi:hypothetical protein
VKTFSILAIALFTFCAFSLSAQNSEGNIYGFSNKENKRFDKYWIRRSSLFNINYNDSLRITGQPLFVADNELFLLKPSQFFINSMVLDSQIQIIPLKSISNIYLSDKYNKRSSGKIGAIIGSGVGIIYSSLLVYAGMGYIPPIIIPPSAAVFGFTGGLIGWSFFNSKKEYNIYNKSEEDKTIEYRIEKHLLFPDSLPGFINISDKEQIVIDTTTVHKTRLLHEMLNYSPKMKKVFREHKFAISGEYGNYIFNNNDLIFPLNSLGIDFLYSLNKKFYLEYGYKYREYQIELGMTRYLGSEYVFERYLRGTVNKNHILYGHYNLIPYSQFTNQKIRISVALGLGHSNLNEEITNSYTFDNIDENSDNPDSNYEYYWETIRLDNNLLSVHTKLEIEYKIIKYLSIYSNFDKFFLKKIEIPAFEFTHPNTGEFIRVDNSEINLSGIDLMFGMRIWLF